MAIYTVKNVRQLYVANRYSANASAAGAFVGALSVDGGKAFHLKFTNVDGIQFLSDKITIDNIRMIKAIPYAPKVLRQDKVTISAPVVGQTYILGVNFRSWGSGSQENTYYKHIGAYTAVTGDTAETIVDKMIDLGTKNFSREPGKSLSFAKEGNNILVINEVEQEWFLGKAEGRNLDYVLKVAPIVVSGVETHTWATIATTFGKPGLGTYRQAADMEYFYMGEKGDQYGMVGYPYDFPVKYLVEGGVNYNIVEIAYFATYEGDSVQAAEKQLTILCKKGSGVMAEIISAINAIKPGLINVVADAIPGIITTPVSNIAFANTVSGATSTQTLNIKGVELSGNVLLAVSGDDFSLSAYSVSKTDAEANDGTNITVTFAPTTIGAKTGNIVVKHGDFVKVITLTGTATLV